MTLQERIKEQMAEKKISQKELAEMTGLTEASVSKYVNGKREPRIDVILKLAKAFNVSTDYLLQGCESQTLHNPFNEVKMAVARSKNELSEEEKTKLIKFILEDIEWMKSDDYEDIKQLVSEVYEDYGIDCVPVDIFSLIEKMGFKLVFSSVLLKKKKARDKVIDIYNFCKLPDGFSFYCKEYNTYFIFVNDLTCTIERQRFSVAHELGHILMGHKGFYFKTEEDKADYFAHYLLSLTSLVIIPEVYDKFVNNLECVQSVFYVSLSQADIFLRYSFNRLKVEDGTIYSYETVINSHIQDSVINKILEWA